MSKTVWAAAFTICSGLFFIPDVAHSTAGRWPVIYAAAIYAVFVFARYIWSAREIRVWLIDALIVAFVAWAGLSVTWSGDYLTGLHSLLNIFALSAIALLVRHSRDYDRGIAAGLAVAVPGALVLAYLLPAKLHGGFGNENFISEYLVMALPFILFSPWKWARLLAAPTVVYLLFYNPSNIEFAVAAAGILVGVIWLVRRRQYAFASIATLAGVNAVLHIPA